jgi:hypothetical protein
MTVWCVGLDETAVPSIIDKINFPDDGHMAVRNM